MNEILQLTDDAWRQLGGLDTAEEIQQQPAIWRALATDLSTQRERIERFLEGWLAHHNHRVILTGAGSSAYIGEVIADELDASWAARVRAIPSTSLLTHPWLYLDPKAPTLLVSFARSGIAAHWKATYQNILELAEACDVPVRWSCRSGGLRWPVAAARAGG